MHLWLPKKNNIPVFHYEAEIDLDNKLPEINRKIVDPYIRPKHDLQNYQDNLIMEGLHPEKVIEIGSPMKRDFNYYKKIDNSKILKV